MRSTSSRRLLLLMLLGLSSSPLIGGMKSPLPIAPSPVAPSPATIAAPKLPNELTDRARKAMAIALNVDSASIQIIDARSTTWIDCALPQVAQCRPIAQQGWRVTLRGKKNVGQTETWQYLINQRDRRITLDSPASLSPVVRRAIAQQAQRPVNQLKIHAAQLIQVLPSCPPGALCKRSPIPAWRVLLDGAESPYTLDLQGKKITEDFRQLLPKDLAGMPAQYGQQLIEDVRDRIGGQLPANFMVASVRAVEWNACTGEGDIRPSIMPMGACPNFTQRAWQVVTQGGPVRWTYYLPRPEVIPGDPIGNAVPLLPLDAIRPDGLQSLPRAVADRVLRLPVRAGITDRRLFWADAAFFDGCLNPASALTQMSVDGGFTQALTCRTIVQPGWRMTVHTNGPSFDPVRGPIGTPALNYHTTQDGRRSRLINETQWLPPPVAPSGAPF